jgi:hypothetical protein
MLIVTLMEEKTLDNPFAIPLPVSAQVLATLTPCAHLAKTVNLMAPAELATPTTTVVLTMEEKSLVNPSAKLEVYADLAHPTPTAEIPYPTAEPTDNATTALMLETLAEPKTALPAESEPIKSVAIPKLVCV